jgi:Protein of unknown function (DUF2911)
MSLRLLAAFACNFLIASSALLQAQAPMGGMKMDQPAANAPMPSPPATANVTLGGKAVSIQYNAPSLRGRHIGSPDFVPYGQWWRTGANPATTLVSPTNLRIGTLTVPAGTYTIYTLPTANTWQLIINKQTGQWGTEYHQEQDLGRTPMTSKPISSSQEVMSISFENTHGNSTELHVRWGTTDQYVPVVAQ